MLTKEKRDVLNLMNPVAQNVGLGDEILAATGFRIGPIYYLDPTRGADSNDGLSYETAWRTLPAAYAKLKGNINETLVYIAGTSSITLSAQLNWSKSYTHFIGATAPVGAGKRARIFQLSTATGVDLFKVSGNGNIFKNLYMFHGVDDATSLICMTVTGQRNYFENCHFAGIGNATMSAAGSASLKIDGGAENYFYNCQIGLDTITRDADATELWVDTAATRNKFEKCLFYGYAGHADYSLITLEDGQAIDRHLWFKDCVFYTDSVNQTITMGTVFNIKAAIVQGKIILEDCKRFTDGSSGAGVWDSNSRGIIFNNQPAAAASGAGGVMTKL